ncbi:MAG: M48 family metallopeptidase [Pseudomonadota bacterium]
MLIKLLPFLLIAVGLYAWVRVQAWASGRNLRRQSRPLANDRLERLVAQLAETAGVDQIRVRVLDQAMINGLATPGGEIYVTSGLVREVQRGRVSADEFASVVAHELGHLALGHTRRRIIEVTGAQAATLIVGGLLARLIPVVGWYLARFISNFFVASLSRKDEFEADRYATALMLRAGLGAEPQARMLEKLEELAPGAHTYAVSWLASHPPVAERARAIRENAGRWLTA